MVCTRLKPVSTTYRQFRVIEKKKDNLLQAGIVYFWQVGGFPLVHHAECVTCTQLSKTTHVRRTRVWCTCEKHTPSTLYFYELPRYFHQMPRSSGHFRDIKICVDATLAPENVGKRQQPFSITLRKKSAIPNLNGKLHTRNTPFVYNI